MIITLRDERAELVVSTRGAVIRSWVVDGVQVIDGYLNDAEELSLDGYRSAVLVPWANRIADGRWVDRGVVRDVADAGNADPQGLHGLVCEREFEVVAKSPLSVTLSCSIEETEGYPYALAVSVTYRISHRQLGVTITARNESDGYAPVSLGWHPYFFKGQTRSVATDAQMFIDVDSRGIPTVDPFKPFDGFTDGVPTNWDNALTAVSPVISLPVRGGSVMMRANLPSEVPGEGVWHVYAGGTLERGAGESIAVEPCLHMADAFNRMPERVRLAPGKTRDLNVSVEFFGNP